MSGTFRKGDMLRLEDVSFDQLQRGDVVTFYQNTGNIKDTPLESSSFDAPKMISLGTNQTVHRIIRVHRGEYLITQGDNNSSPDPFVYPIQNPRRVVEVLRNNRFLPVASGRRGMIRFRLLQLRRQLRCGLAFFIRPILNTAPLALFRFEKSKLEIAHFSDRDILYKNQEPFAVRPQEKKDWVILSPIKRFFYSGSYLNREFPVSDSVNLEGTFKAQLNDKEENDNI